MPLSFSNPSKLLVWGYGLLCPSFGRKFYKMLVNILQLRGDEHILDFGSGAGVLAKKVIKMLNEEGQLTCLDISPTFLNKARRKLHKYNNANFKSQYNNYIMQLFTYRTRYRYVPFL